MKPTYEKLWYISLKFSNFVLNLAKKQDNDILYKFYSKTLQLRAYLFRKSLE